MIFSFGFFPKDFIISIDLHVVEGIFFFYAEWKIIVFI